MSEHEARGKAYWEEANRLAGAYPIWWWFSFSSKWEDVGTSFKNAADQYFLAGSCMLVDYLLFTTKGVKAARAYKRAAQYYMRENSRKQDGAHLYCKAASCYKRIAATSWLTCYEY
jgi:hypothetical protein